MDLMIYLFTDCNIKPKAKYAFHREKDRIALTEVEYFSNIYYHILFQYPKLIGTSFASTS
jgi:hypothetical protein